LTPKAAYTSKPELFSPFKYENFVTNFRNLKRSIKCEVEAISPVSAASPHRSTTNAKKKKRAAPSDLEPDQSAAKIAAVEESVPGAAAVKESTSIDIDAEMMLDL